MNITDVRYFYYRDERRRPLITLCAVRADDGRIGYGWAICSASDQVHKDDWYDDDPHDQRSYVFCAGGKRIARGRAEVALTKRGRGIPCCDWVGEGAQRHRQSILNYVWRYARRINRDEAKRVIHACGAPAEALWLLTEYGDGGGLPKALLPEALTARHIEDSAYGVWGKPEEAPDANAE